VRAILGDNAIRCYSLDHEQLATAASSVARPLTRSSPASRSSASSTSSGSTTGRQPSGGIHLGPDVRWWPRTEATSYLGQNGRKEDVRRAKWHRKPSQGCPQLRATPATRLAGRRS